MTHPWTLIAIALLVLAQDALGATKTRYREDLGRKLRALACESKTLKDIRASWRLGVFDAQIEGRIYERSDGLPVKTEDIARKAKSMARTLHYGGFGYGLCSNGRGFIVAAPSPMYAGRSENKIFVPVSTLEKRCRSWRVDYTPHAANSKTRRLSVEAKRVDISRLDVGTISISCIPKKPRWLGRQLWHLLPTRSVASIPDDIPGLSKVKIDSRSPVAVAATLDLWVAQLREIHGLTPAARLALLDQEADMLAIDARIAHNRTLLAKTKKSLAQDSLAFLGENRARGHSIHETAWLLWNSPLHRQLILHPKADRLGIAIRQTKAQIFAVLTFAEAKSITTATRKK